MDEAEIFAAATKVADLGLKALNFYILVSAAFGGWLITSGKVLAEKPFSPMRRLLAAIYLCAAGTIAVGTVLILERVEDMLTVARIMAIEAERSDEYLKIYAAGGNLAAWALGIITLLMVLMILMARWGHVAGTSTSK